MTREELAGRLCRMQPQITNVIGFHDLLDDDSLKLTPLQTMTYEVHFTASGLALAHGLLQIIRELKAGE